MVKTFSIIFLVVAATTVNAQLKIDGLPPNATILETKQIVSSAHTNRLLVLWMLNPKRNPVTEARDEEYTCPTQTRGSYYSGPANVSLVDSSENKVINTVKVSSYESDDGDIDLPYAIRPGYYYRVDKVNPKTAQGKPTILWLRDYNGDGKALEFALFDAPACMGLQTALIGFSEKQDKVIKYPINVTATESGKRSQETLYWADYLFNRKPVSPGHWNYEIDYRGRGGSLDKWVVNYNSANEQFEATVTRTPDEP